VTVGFSSSDCEISRQNCAGESDHYFVTHREVVRSANDTSDISAAVLRLLSSRRNANLAPINRLAVALFFRAHLKYLAHNNRAGDIKAVNVFFFKPNADELSVHLLNSDIRVKLDILAKPAQWNAH
jgi:hypothetical protein